MQIRQLRALIAVADCGGINAAADALFLSIPAISTQLSNLERELKAELFNRKRKPLRLNATGQLVLLQAREIVSRCDHIAESISEPGEVAGSLVLGSISTALTSVIPKALLTLRELYPRLQISVFYGLSPTFVEQLRHREIDAAIMSEPLTNIRDVIWEHFASTPVVVIAPKNARANSDETLLKELPYIRLNRQLWISRQIERSLISRNIVLRESMEIDSLESIALMVRNGLGVSIIPLSSQEFIQDQQLKFVPFGRPRITQRIGLAEKIDNPKKHLTAVLLNALKQSVSIPKTRTRKK